MTLREQIIEYRRRMNAFNEWEADNVMADTRPITDILADLSFLCDRTSAETWLEDPDPEKAGIRAFRAKLEFLWPNR